MNFFVKKTVLVAVVLGLIGTVYAPVYSPGVAERIIKNALVEVKRTGTIKDVVQFKQAYQDLPRMSKEDYQDDYESILKAAQKAVMQKKPIVVPVKIDTVPEPKPKESISKKTENEKKLEVYLSELERIKEKERKGQELLEQERIKKEQLDKQRQEQERQKEEDRIKSEKQEKEKIERQLEEVKRQQEALDKQLQLQEKDNQEPLKKEKQEQNKQLNDQEKIQKEQKPEPIE